MQKTTCLECRHGTFRQQKVQAGKDKLGNVRHDYVPKYICSFHNVTHGVDQTSCGDYIGDITLFEYLMHTQPQKLYDLLSRFGLKVVNSKCKQGFDIVGE